MPKREGWKLVLSWSFQGLKLGLPLSLIFNFAIAIKKMWEVILVNVKDGPCYQYQQGQKQPTEWNGRSWWWQHRNWMIFNCTACKAMYLRNCSQLEITKEKDLDMLANHPHSVWWVKGVWCSCTRNRAQQKAVILTDSFDASRFLTRERPWILYSFSEPAFEFLETFWFPIQTTAN